MLKIRLKRVGRKHDPHFRVVVTEHTRGPKSNDFVESIGFYNPKTKAKSIDAERVKHWLSVGAQPSDTVHNMLISEKIVDGKKINVLPQKSPVVSENESKQEDMPDEATAPVAEDSDSTQAPTATGAEAESKDTNSAQGTDGSEAPTVEAPKQEEVAQEINDEVASDAPMESQAEETTTKSDIPEESKKAD